MVFLDAGWRAFARQLNLHAGDNVRYRFDGEETFLSGVLLPAEIDSSLVGRARLVAVLEAQMVLRLLFLLLLELCLLHLLLLGHCLVVFALLDFIRTLM